MKALIVINDKLENKEKYLDALERNLINSRN